MPSSTLPARNNARAEQRRHRLIDDALGVRIGQVALETLADLDADAALGFGDHQQDAFVRRFAAKLPCVDDLDARLLDGLIPEVGDGEHGDLRTVGLLVQSLQGAGDLALGGGRKHAGAIDDGAGEARDVESPERQRQNCQQEHAETMRGQNSTVGVCSTRSVSASSSDHCAIFSWS
jgi:hypothetical protein